MFVCTATPFTLLFAHPSSYPTTALTHTHTYTHLHSPTLTDTHIHTHTYTLPHTHTPIHTHTHTRTHAHTHTHAPTHTPAHRTHPHPHTHTHTHRFNFRYVTDNPNNGARDLHKVYGCAELFFSSSSSSLFSQLFESKKILDNVISFPLFFPFHFSFIPFFFSIVLDLEILFS